MGKKGGASAKKEEEKEKEEEEEEEDQDDEDGGADGAELDEDALAQAELLASYDLCPRMTLYLDRHLIFPLFNFLQEARIYKQKDLTRAEIQLLLETNMLDFAVDKFNSLGEEAPESLTERRDLVLKQLEGTRGRELRLLKILEDDDSVKKLQSCKSLDEMCKEFDLTLDVIDGLVDYAKFMYDCGDYTLSGELLKHYRGIIEKATEDERRLLRNTVNCIWGLLASIILTKDEKWHDLAADVVMKLDDDIEKSKVNNQEKLHQRRWLLHWTLFPLFTAEKVDEKILQFFLNEKSLSIISLSCPHLFRYVASCLILHKRLKHLVKDTVKILHHESASYSDPVTRFLLALYTDMDFDEAQRELKQCELVCKGDYFLNSQWSEFEENSRLLIFETYCRIHQCINIKMIASKLNMEAEEAELWIVKLIQSAKLDARIDSEKSRVVMSKAPPSVYQQVIEKTKNLAFRSTMLIANLEKREKDKGSIP